MITFFMPKVKYYLTIFSTFAILFLKFPKKSVVAMKKIASLFLLFALLLTACASDAPKQCELFAMDTLMQVKIWGDSSLLDEVAAEINRLDAALSATATGSEVYALNRDGAAELSEETAALLRQAVALSEKTDGAFDPTVYPLVKLWGFPDGNYRVPADAELSAATVGTEHIHFTNHLVTLDDGCAIDLGAIGKGYAAQRCITLLAQSGAECALLSLGGNVQTLGTKPDGSDWVVGIADPKSPSAAIAEVTFQGSLALVTSGSYQRYFELDGEVYHHILDPQTRRPAESGLASVTVLAENGTVADAYSTALFVMGLENGVEFWRESADFEAVFITDDGQIYVTQGAASMIGGCEFQVIAK